MKMLIVGVLLLVIALLGASASYISGRIVLPEMGLTAPEYVVWAWSWIFSTAIGVLIYAVRFFIALVLD